MRERPNDIRVTKTIRTIHATFEAMMCEMEYRDITVKELCERALINKKTFYRYYETMDYLLAEFQEDLMADYLSHVEGLRIPEDLEQITREFFAFSAQRGQVFERITCAGPHANLQQQMTRRVMERHDGEIPPDPQRSLLLAYVSESTLAVYRQWVADGKAMPIEQATDMAVRLVCHGALPQTS